MTPVEIISHKDRTIEIYQDEDPQNPRNDDCQDNVETMVCFHNRYNLGDKHDYRSEDYSGWDEMEAAIRKEHNPVVLLPLYLYDHSGITISTTQFSCPWDSMRVGFVFLSRKATMKNWGKKRVSQKMKEMAEKMVKSSVEEYDQYLRGDVYGYVIKDKDGEKIDSCWGFYGLEYAIESAREAA